MSKLIIVLDCPAREIKGTDEYCYRMKLLEKIMLTALHAKADDFVFEYLMPDKSSIEGVEFLPYQKEFGERIMQYDPECLICVGDYVCKALTGVSGITKVHGQVYSTAIFGKLIKLIPVFSPGYIQKNPETLDLLAIDIYKGYRIASGVGGGFQNEVVVCDTFEKVKELIGYIKKTGECCFDYETTTLTKLETFDPHFRVTTLAVSFQPGSSWVIPLEHFDSPFNKEDVQTIMNVFGKHVLANEKVRKTAHNLKFEMHVSKRYGQHVFRGRLDDTMLMHHLLNEDERHGLKEITADIFPETSGYADLVKQWKWEDVPLKELCIYGASDSDLTLRLRILFESKLLEDERLYRIYRNEVIPGLRALCEAEHNGMYVDRKNLLKYIARAGELIKLQEEKMRKHPVVMKFEMKQKDKLVDAEIAKLRDKIETAKGAALKRYEDKLANLKIGNTDIYEGLNFGSPKQLGDLLYTKEGFNFKEPYDRSKRKEAKSTGKDFLNELEDKTGFVDMLLLWRTISKTLSTYLIGIYDRLDDNDRVHTSFLQHGTETGRLSSRNPNLQNLTNVTKLVDPIAIEVVEMVKAMFIAPEGYTMLQADFSQIELRVIAEFADEKNMLKAYANNEDLHALTASRMLHTTLENFNRMDAKEQKKYRTRAKPSNFGLIYLISDEGFVDYAKNNYGVDFSMKEAREIRRIFFEAYPKLLEYHDLYITKGEKYGYVRTLFGRKRLLPDIHSDSDFYKGQDCRVAVNSPVQGTAGELTIFGFSLLVERLDPRVLFANTVHDSILFYVPNLLVMDSVRIIYDTLENLPTKRFFGRELEKVKLKIDIESGTGSWKDLAAYGG